MAQTRGNTVGDVIRKHIQNWVGGAVHNEILDMVTDKCDDKLEGELVAGENWNGVSWWRSLRTVY
jgi:hypothetical protein